MKTDNDTDLLLFRYIKGTVSETELAEVERLMAGSAEARKTVEQLCVLDHGSEALKCMRESEPQLSLSKAKRKIRNHKVHRIFVWTQRAAAVLFLPLLCMTAYFALHQPESKDIPPQWVEMVSAPGVVSSIVLPDSTKVWLNAGSRIAYPTFFSGDTRKVTVSGEAYFAVTENRAKPFLVNVSDAFNIAVTGTEFNVEAYPSADVFSVTLVEGSVQATSIDNPSKPLLTLQPEEQLVWNVQNKTMKVNKVNTLVVSSWKDGKIIFKNTTMAEIAAMLEKRYNAHFVISPRLMDYSFTGTFTNQQLVQILELFRISSGIKYEIKDYDMNPDGTVNRSEVHLR